MGSPVSVNGGRTITLATRFMSLRKRKKFTALARVMVWPPLTLTGEPTPPAVYWLNAPLARSASRFRLAERSTFAKPHPHQDLRLRGRDFHAQQVHRLPQSGRHRHDALGGHHVFYHAADKNRCRCRR